VLSFAALETDLPGAETLHQYQPLYLGDIIISVETAARQAQAAQHSLEQEIAWLTAHGLLHLLGWDHPDEASLVQMLEKQTQLLALVKIGPSPGFSLGHSREPLLGHNLAENSIKLADEATGEATGN
jgi:rRNA maturation RNase YbeY